MTVCPSISGRRSNSPSIIMLVIDKQGAAVSQTCYLILDQGGQSSRALVINVAGQTLSHAAVAVATQTPTADRAEQDADELVNSLQQVAEQAVSQLSTAQRQGLDS